jgi:thiamine-monophosphate kinase
VRAEKRLLDVGEDILVEELTRGLPVGEDVVVGAGDDCAVVRGSRRGWSSLLKADCIVEGVHFLKTAPPAKVGWKAMARAISDIAAMGGRPSHALVTIVVHPQTTVAWTKGVYRGLTKAARAYDVSIVGGETSRSAVRGATVISIALTGKIASRHLVLRSGGRAGDVLFVTGRLGGAAGGRHLSFCPRLEEGAWLAENFAIHAMMDLSDGLAKDLPRLARASGLGFDLDVDSIPRNRGCDMEAALSDGEDYELLFAVSARTASALERDWKSQFPRVALTPVGRLLRNVRAGENVEGGWDHFGK